MNGGFFFMGTRKSTTSRKATGKGSASSSRRAGKTIRAAIDGFLLDRESRNFSPKTLLQHRTSLAHLANFLLFTYVLLSSASVLATCCLVNE